jgi:hypothetical protein
VRTRLIRAAAAAAAAATAISAAMAFGPAATAAPGATPPPAAPTASHVRKACAAAPQPGRMQCLALLRTAADGAALPSGPAAPSAPPLGYGPAQLQDAYGLTTLAADKGSLQTVAIVDAFDNPSAESDLARYRTKFGLPACTTGNGCFRKVNQNGQPAPLPAANSDWALEESLDIDMVAATCPLCRILLVEADDNTDVNLGAAVATAGKLGAVAISNSYGEPEFPGETALEPFFDQPGVLVTAAAGDSGYGVSYPAASANVTSVGGTSLFPSTGSRGWQETTWGGTGSGCSTQLPKPSWQHDACSHRMGNDIAAVADPATAVAVYDTFGQPGWVRVGGTSVSSPIVASVWALIGDPHDAQASYFYRHTDHLFDVAAGANGNCSPSFLCEAGPGYDGPTGLGTPNIAAITDSGGACVGGWSASPPLAAPPVADVRTSNSQFARNWDVAALSPSNVWTVGGYSLTTFTGPAGTSGYLNNVEHWNGSAWKQIPAPNPVATLGETMAEFVSVSFDAPNDGWAVGFQSLGTGVGVLIAHWDGTRWSLSPALNPAVTVGSSQATGLANAAASAVAAISPRDVWVAVDTGTVVATLFKEFRPSGTSFFEHWDGTTWSLVPVPDDGSGAHVVLAGLHAFSSDDVWAVGHGQDPASGESVGVSALHWDGRSWSATDAAVGDPHAVFESVSGSSPRDVWAVGTTVDDNVSGLVPLIEHWDGASWSIVPAGGAESVASGGTRLYGVTAISPSDAWAVGEYAGHVAGEVRTAGLYLLEHWDGHQWNLVDTPRTSVEDGLWAVSASDSANAWIAGSDQLSIPAFPGYADYPNLLRFGCGR